MQSSRIAGTLLLSLGLVAAAPSAAGARPTPLVHRAIDAPYTDVRIAPITEARAFWQARVDARPEDALSRTKLASTILAQAKETGDLSLYPVAETQLRDVLAVSPTDESALLGLAGARAANHDFTTAMQLAEDVLTRNPYSKAARAAVADANFELGHYDLAAQQLDALAADLPDQSAIAGRRAKLAAIRGDTRSAINDAAQSLVAAARTDLRPSDAAFYRFQLAYFLYQGGEVERAHQALQAALRIDPTHLASLELEAKVLVSLNRREEAASLLEQLVARTPAADLHGDLAKVYRSLGEDDKAEQQAQLGLQVGYAALEQYPAERRHLAGFFAEFDPPTALTAAEADFTPRQDVGAYDALAWAYYVNGRYDDAARTLQGALAQGTRSATLLYHAGMIEHAVGNDAAARRHLGDALGLDAHFDVAQAPIAKATLSRLTSPTKP